MKSLSVIASILFILISQVTRADEAAILVKWRTLSARTQNLYSELQLIPKNGNADPSTYETQLQGVSDALDELVAVGELESKRITIQSPVDAEEKEMKAVAHVIRQIGKEYGIFVASEMCDLGARLKFMIMKPDEPIELHLRLPERYLKMFLEAVGPAIVADNIEKDEPSQSDDDQPEK